MVKLKKETLARLLPVVAYIILAFAVGYTFQKQADARKDTATQLRVSQLQGCERTNDLRANLRDIVRIAITQSVPPGSTEQVTGDANKLVLRLTKNIGPIDCEKVYPPLNTNGGEQ